MIAKTILQQIGGKRFTAMTGSRDFIDMGNGLRMSLARNKTSANRLDIIYDEGADLYNMRFYRRTFSKKTLHTLLSGGAARAALLSFSEHDGGQRK